MTLKFLENKNIIFLGLGVTVFESALALKKYIKNIYVVTNSFEGSYYTSLKELGYTIISEEKALKLDNIDLILKSPGVPFDNQVLRKFKSVALTNDIELAYLYIKENKLDTQIIAITGTNGKTSTALYLESLLYNAGYSVQCSGNIGVSPLNVLDNIENLDFLILELSSFQLKNINEFKAKYAFLLNITPDHLNLHENFEDYVKCKKNIYKNSTSEDFLFVKDKVYNEFIKDDDVIPTIIKPNKEEEIENKIKANDFLGINFNNLLLCFKLCNLLNISDEVFFDTLKGFKGFEHRIEFVDEIDGVNYYNDSKATNLGAMKESISRLDNIILIVGGVSDESFVNFDGYLKNVKLVISFGKNKDKFLTPKIYARVNTLKEALILAKEVSHVGDNILLSPASKSFDQYANYKVRGQDFKKIIKEFN